MERVLTETSEYTAIDIVKILGISDKNDNIETLKKLLEEKRIDFHKEEEKFTYFLKKPLKLADDSKIECLTIQESNGYELSKIQDLSHPFRASMDLIAIQNGISTEIINRVKHRDIVNLTSLLSFFRRFFSESWDIERISFFLKGDFFRMGSRNLYFVYKAMLFQNKKESESWQKMRN